MGAVFEHSLLCKRWHMPCTSAQSSVVHRRKAVDALAACSVSCAIHEPARVLGWVFHALADAYDSASSKPREPQCPAKTLPIALASIRPKPPAASTVLPVRGPCSAPFDRAEAGTCSWWRAARAAVAVSRGCRLSPWRRRTGPRSGGVRRLARWSEVSSDRHQPILANSHQVSPCPTVTGSDESGHVQES